MSRSVLLSSVRYIMFLFYSHIYVIIRLGYLRARAAAATGPRWEPPPPNRALPPRPNETGPARRRHKSSSLLTHNRLSSAAASSRRSLFLCPPLPASPAAAVSIPRLPPPHTRPFPYADGDPTTFLFSAHTHTHALEYVQGLQVPMRARARACERIADGCTKMSSPSK